MKRFTILFGLAVLFLTSVVLADIPKLINFQGILRDGSGNPVANGVYTVRFRVYDDSTAGSTLWEETVPVPTTSGLFSVRLGDATALPHNLFSTGANRFVGIRVNLDPEMAPRTRIISVPYAFHALRSDSAATATIALDLTCTGCVGNSDLANGAVSEAKLADGSVTNAKILDGTIGSADIDASQVQRRVTGTAPPGEYITAINQDGSVTTAADQTGAASGWNDDGTVVRLLTGGDDVGIGTSSPGAKLQIDALTSVKKGLIIRGGSSGIVNLQEWQNFGGSALSIVDASGRFGLGTTSPSARLGVESATGTEVGIRVRSAATQTAFLQEWQDNSGTALASVTASGIFNGNGSLLTNLNASNIATGNLGTARMPGGGNWSLSSDLNVNSGQLFLNQTSAAVGIGTTTPTKKLDVAGSIKGDTVFSNVLSSNSPLALQAPAGTTRMFIDDVTGNVGIGTASPGAPLEVNYNNTDAFAPAIAINNPNVGGQDVIDFRFSGTTHASIRKANGGGLFVGTLNTDALNLVTNDANRLTISGAGNVGIGTTAPSTALEVAGQISPFFGSAAAPAYAFAADLNTGIYRPSTDVVGISAGGIEQMRINFLGNVGIGTTSPVNKLDVEGGAAIGATYSGTNTAPTNGLLVEGNVGIGTTGPSTPLQVTGQISASGGTASAPAYTFAGDLNTGIYGGSDFLNFATGGVQRGYITSNGQFVMLSRAQIGTNTSFGDPSTLYVQGSIASDITTIVSNTTLTSSNSVVLVNTGTATVTLPGAGFAPGRQYTIKKISASAGIITVDGNGAETIDGAATYSLTAQYQYVVIVSNGSNWFVVANN